MAGFVAGQRYISEPEPELGLGTVVSVGSFQAAIRFGYDCLETGTFSGGRKSIQSGRRIVQGRSSRGARGAVVLQRRRPVFLRRCFIRFDEL